MWTGINDVYEVLIASYFKIAAIDLVDEAAAKLKMEMTSKPSAIDEIDRSILETEMIKLSLENENDSDSKERSKNLENKLSNLKKRQAELTKQWNDEKSVIIQIHTIKKLVSNYTLFFFVKGSLYNWKIEKKRKDTEHLYVYLCIADR